MRNQEYTYLVGELTANGRALIRRAAAEEAKSSAKSKARAYFAKLNADERYWR